MLQVIIGVLLTVLITVAFGMEFKRQKLRARYKHILTAKEFPFIGTKFILSQFDMSEFLRYFKELYTAPIGKVFIAHRVAFVISDPEAIKDIAQSNVCLERPLHLKFWPYWNSIMTNRYNEWRPIRKAANLAWSQKFSTNMIPTMNKYFTEMTNSMEKALLTYKTQPIDMFELVKAASFAQIMGKYLNY